MMKGTVGLKLGVSKLERGQIRSILRATTWMMESKKILCMLYENGEFVCVQTLSVFNTN